MDATEFTRVLTAGYAHMELAFPLEVNRVGYGIGLNFRPNPAEFYWEFTPSADFVLEPGMILNGKGIGISDTIAVTKNSPEFITKFPRELLEK